MNDLASRSPQARDTTALSRSLSATIIANGIIRLGNELIERPPAHERVGRIRRRSRLGGLLNYYARAA